MRLQMGVFLVGLATAGLGSWYQGNLIGTILGLAFLVAGAWAIEKGVTEIVEGKRKK